MSKLNEIISRYHQKLTEATLVAGRTAPLTIVAEYRKAIEIVKDCSEDIRDELIKIVDKPDRPRLDLVLIAVYVHPNQVYVDSLCTLLSRGDPALPNELIVDLLYKIPSPKSVPYLAKASSLTFTYDEYNEFGVKCLDALAVINTGDAWAVIEGALRSSSVRIRECAQKLLNSRINSRKST